jgi:MFS family permease
VEINACLPVIASVVVTAGRFGEISRRQRVFLIGFAVFGLGSLVCATAWSADVLIAGRVLMALGAASTLALVTMTSRTTSRRGPSASGRQVEAVGARAAIGTGMAIGAPGLVILTRIGETSGYAILSPGQLLVGLAFALVYAPMPAAATAAMPKANAGIASSSLAMNRMS